ncbi:unnamed protein product [Adineta ricciae]|uniref:Glucuronosyltransferase n=1 Tax=Adineta ricciae TaxID=249248 RepID=A0A816EMJ4_ADIRI|nr:unnamed protein product [Adineta ricciae]
MVYLLINTVQADAINFPKIVPSNLSASRFGYDLKITFSSKFQHYQLQDQNYILCTSIPASHVAPIIAICQELVDRGHNVVLVLEEKEFNKIKDFWTGGHLIVPDSIDRDTLTEIQLALSSAPFYELLKTIFDLLSVFSWTILETYPILMKKPPVFIICDIFTSAGFILAEKFNIPAVATWSGQSMTSANDYVSPMWYSPANSMSPANFLAMTYFEMVKNVFSRLLSDIVSGFVGLESINMQRRHFGVRELEHPIDISQQYPLFLSSPIGLDFAHPILPSHFPIGPYFRSNFDKTNLPNDLQLWLDQATNVIYISFGTATPPNFEQIQTIHRALEKQNKSLRYLWSLDKPYQHMLEKANISQLLNVRYASYLPQIAILKHPNVILFLSHGGFNSVAESLIFNKPMLIIPLTSYMDHADNGLRVQKAGGGLMHFGWHMNLTLLQEQISLLLENITVNIVDNNNITYLNPNDFKKLNHFYADAHRIARLFRSAGGTTRAATIIEEFLEFGYQHLIFNQPGYKQLVILYTLVLFTSIAIIAPLLLLFYCCCRRMCCHKLKSKLIKKKAKVN